MLRVRVISVTLATLMSLVVVLIVGTVRPNLWPGWLLLVLLALGWLLYARWLAFLRTDT